MPIYDRAHRRLRAQLAPLVAAGQATCWRCTELIPPGAPWDLGHDDDDPSLYRGPEHQRCSRAAGADKRNEAANQPGPPSTKPWW